MKLEQLLPKKETAEKLSVDLETVLDDLEGLDAEDLINAPREYILKGKILARQLKQIRTLGVEFTVSGEKDRLVLSTGSVGCTEPDPRAYIQALIDDNKEFPSVTERIQTSPLSMHSHDSEIGVVPSIPDIIALRNAVNSASLLFTSEGILSYSWNKDFDVEQKFLSFLEIKYPVENIFDVDTFYELDKPRQIELLSDFYNNFDVLIKKATWDEEEKCQAILDQYFSQNS